MLEKKQRAAMPSAYFIINCTTYRNELQVKLSVLTTTKLPPHLQSIKRKLGLTLIKFEDATIELEPFIKKHPFESSQFLIHSIIRHYKDVSL